MNFLSNKSTTRNYYYCTLKEYKRFKKKWMFWFLQKSKHLPSPLTPQPPRSFG